MTTRSAEAQNKASATRLRESCTTSSIRALLDEALASAETAQRLIDQIVVKGMALGLDWRDIVTAVDEAERRTGLALHPVRNSDISR